MKADKTVSEGATLSETIALETSKLDEDKKTSLYARLTAKIASLEKKVLELESTLKQSVRETARDLDGLWTNSDLLFQNAVKLQEAIKTIGHAAKSGPKTISRIDKTYNRLKAAKGLKEPIAKRDLWRWLGLNSRQAGHHLWKALQLDSRFSTYRRGKYCFITLKPLLVS